MSIPQGSGFGHDALPVVGSGPGTLLVSIVGIGALLVEKAAKAIRPLCR